ncbi:N-acetylneuraminate lyase [uncultured Brachyspira sp.]|uniref:N-acetylneuraminate lyase n=1 Tax=uncultured Brachyspira sp. TaxID=221953 RepID=UPI0025E15F55|nr:N-acetylneuraminate lyase [uncultured Brachyspira sp.]
MNKCEGILSALMTPFNKNGKLDEKVLRKYIRHNIDHMKADGLYVGGSTGECLLMSKEERIAVLEITKEEVAGKIPLIAHVGTLNLNEACEMAQKAEELGYDLISAVTPYYYPFSFADISKYYNTILKETKKVPLVIYFLPTLSNNKISLDEFGKLFEDKRVMGIKYTSSDVFLLERLIQKYPDKMMWAGFDEMLIAYASYGLRSGIGSTYNIQAPLAKKVIQAVENKDMSKALKIQHDMNDIITVLLNVGIYPALKECVALYDSSAAAYCRAPMGGKTLGKSEKKVLKNMFDKYLSKL